ncbi:MAG: hypothetical protein ABSF10_03070 [Verrucomicrobiota bacterium]|jgi:hypothetical protein
MSASFSMQQIATVELRDCAFLRQIHETVVTIGSRCSHAAFVHVRALVTQANNVFELRAGHGRLGRELAGV